MEEQLQALTPSSGVCRTAEVPYDKPWLCRCAGWAGCCTARQDHPGSARQQERGRSELKNILQSVGKDHSFSLNLYLEGSKLRTEGGNFFLFLWVITISSFTYWIFPECVSGSKFQPRVLQEKIS